LVASGGSLAVCVRLEEDGPIVGGGVQEVALACCGLLLSTWLIVGDDGAISSGLSGSSLCLWRCSVLLWALFVWWYSLRRVM
jgi:hypothetical protein